MKQLFESKPQQRNGEGMSGQWHRNYDGMIAAALAKAVNNWPKPVRCIELAVLRCELLKLQADYQAKLIANGIIEPYAK